MTMVSETMSKGDFATHINVSPGRISQYIAEGKISLAALEGQGRSAKIKTAVALAELRKTLDPAQRFGANGSASIVPVAVPASLEASAPIATVTDPARDELAAERLKQQRLKTAREQREEDLSIGRYILASDARQITTRAVTEAFKVMDQGIQEMAKALAADFGVSQRDAVLLLHRVMRDTRAAQAAGFREAAANVTGTVEDNQT